jgi:hypothetical protein
MAQVKNIYILKETAMRGKTLKLSLLTLMFAAVVMAGAKSTVAQTATTVTTTIRQPIDFAAQTCDVLESITFSGTVDIVYDVVNGGPGNLKVNINSSWQNVTGSTPSGRQYAGSNESTQSIDLDSLPSQQSFTVSQQWIGKGDGAPSMIYSIKFIINIDANGAVTAQKDSEAIECQQ